MREVYSATSETRLDSSLLAKSPVMPKVGMVSATSDRDSPAIHSDSALTSTQNGSLSRWSSVRPRANSARYPVRAGVATRRPRRPPTRSGHRLTATNAIRRSNLPRSAGTRQCGPAAITSRGSHSLRHNRSETRRCAPVRQVLCAGAVTRLEITARLRTADRQIRPDQRHRTHR
jgi:hypothetical protein